MTLGLTAAAAALSLTIVNPAGAAAAPRFETVAPHVVTPSAPDPTGATPATGITNRVGVRFAAISLDWVSATGWFAYHPRPVHKRATYVVRRGDTFASIANKQHVNWFNLAADNRLHMYAVLRTGEVLRLPRSGEKAHAAMPMHAPFTVAPLPAGSTTTVPTTTPPPVSPAATVTPSASMSSFEQCVISRESGGNPEVMNASGHWGLFQFSESTWVGYGGSPSAFGNASAAVQEQVFANAMARGGESNWAPYDGC